MLLGQISLSELAGSDDLPIISALVVGADEGQPVGGFWSLCDDTLKLGIGTDPLDRLAFWSQELKRCWDVFGSVA